MRNLRTSPADYLIRSISAVVFLYQRVFSPDHGAFREFLGTSRCRFFPSCSEYTLETLSQYGLLKGIMVSLKRIARCGPWSRGGYDPVEVSNS